MDRMSVLFILTLLVYFIIQTNVCSARKRKPVEYNPEEEKNIPVRIKLLGDLATPHPDSGIELGFVPKQVYYQVRRYDEEKTVPQSEALKEAKTPEEVINAPRLREVLTHKKTQEVYEEQGYEDAGYDHGGSARHKEEKERILEDDVIEFGKDNAPNHPDEEQEDEEQPSEEISQSNTDTLDPMNSNIRQRKMKPEKRVHDNKEGKKRNSRRKNGQDKQSYSLDTSEKKSRKYSNDKNDRRSYKREKKEPNNKSRESLENPSPKKKISRRIDNERNPQYETEERRSFDFDTEKYPFYNKLKSNKYTKHSALKYALNPKHVPVKVENKMSFYDSRKLHCDEITGPEIETPNGEEKNPDNSELKNPKRGKPRMGKLGESIDCLKRKFFGHDPLDNPFFKESADF